MVNNRKSTSKEQKERHKGNHAGRYAAEYGHKRAIFGEHDNHSIIYKNAYNEVYEKAVASFNEEKKERRKGTDAGSKAAKSGCKRAIFRENDKHSVVYKNAYNEAYEKAIASFNKEEKERIRGRGAGRYAASYGFKKAIFGENDNHSLVYKNAYNEAYKKEVASSSQDKKERIRGIKAGREAASHGYKRAIFGENNHRSIIYQNAYNEAYEKAVARDSKPKRGFSVAQDTPEYEEEFNSEFFCPQQNLFPSPCSHDFSTPDMEDTIDYSEKLNPPQELDPFINSVEELSEYFDSLSSPAPDAHPLNPLLLQDKATSLNFDTVGDLLGAYETIQPAQLKPRLYQPLFFSTRVSQEPGIRQEASIHFMADRII